MHSFCIPFASFLNSFLAFSQPCTRDILLASRTGLCRIPTSASPCFVGMDNMHNTAKCLLTSRPAAAPQLSFSRILGTRLPPLHPRGAKIAASKEEPGASETVRVIQTEDCICMVANRGSLEEKNMVMAAICKLIDRDSLRERLPSFLPPSPSPSHLSFSASQPPHQQLGPAPAYAHVQ